MKFVQCGEVKRCLLLSRHIVAEVQKEEEGHAHKIGYLLLVYDLQLNEVQRVALEVVLDLFLYCSDCIAIQTTGQQVVFYRQQGKGLKIMQNSIAAPKQKTRKYLLSENPISFLAVGFDTLYLLDEKLRTFKQLSVEEGHNQLEPIILPENNLFVVPSNYNWATTVRSTITLEVLRVLPTIEEVFPAGWAGLVFAIWDNQSRLYNVLTGKILLTIESVDLTEQKIAIRDRNSLEFTVTNFSSIIIYGGFNENPKLELNTKDETLDKVYYWQQGTNIVATSFDSIYLIDLVEELSRPQTASQEEHVFAAM